MKEKMEFKFNYILNDLALYNMAITFLFGVDATDEEKRDLLNQFCMVHDNESILKKIVIGLQDTLRELLHYLKHLHNDCKYNLNNGHIRKMRNIIIRRLGDKDNECN